MPRELELTPRLRLLAEWVPSGARVADIGTDHAYLPVWLLLHNRAVSAIASDLRRGPLARAGETAKAYQVPLDLRLCDGLQGIRPEECDSVVIAGMGGEKITAILAAAPWTAEGRHTLLLQPMTRAEELRKFLAEHRYAIRRERFVFDRGTIYPVIETGAGKMCLSPGELWGGTAPLRDPLRDRYLVERIIRLTGAIAGLSRSRREEDLEKADALREVVTALLSMREEGRRANGS